MNFNGRFYHYLQESIRNRETCLGTSLTVTSKVPGIISAAFLDFIFFPHKTFSIQHQKILILLLVTTVTWMQTLWGVLFIYIFAYLILLFKWGSRFRMRLHLFRGRFYSGKLVPCCLSSHLYITGFLSAAGSCVWQTSPVICIRAGPSAHSFPNLWLEGCALPKQCVKDGQAFLWRSGLFLLANCDSKYRQTLVTSKSTLSSM